MERPTFFVKAGQTVSAGKGLRFLVSIAAFLAGPAFADDAGQSLESAVNDPTASLMAFQLQDYYTSSYHGASGATGNLVQFRAAIPFSFGGLNHITRLTLPYVTKSPSGATGLTDATLFDLATFDRSWGRFGFGAVALLPTGSEGLSAEKWGLGPAAGLVVQKKWGLIGLFNQNIFTVAGNEDMPDVNISTVQPILSVDLDKGWSAGLSEMTIVYDWDAGDFTSLPLGAKLSKMTKIGGKPVQWTVSAEHNFYDQGAIGPENTYGFTAKLLLPK